MVRRISSSQLKSQIRQAQQKQRQAISQANREINKINAANKRAVDAYNREVRAHNARVRSNRQRLRSEIARLNSRPTTTTRFVTYQTSVETLRQSFTRLEEASEQGSWTGEGELFDLAEGETANSLAVLNALLAEAAGDQVAHADLRQTVITTELTDINPDLDARWRGALFALNPQNPDAARHFCTSSRELLTTVLELEAPDEAVLAANPNCPRTPNGSIARRARIHYCLERGGRQSAVFEDFVSDNIENVITLFNDLNPATHGDAGRYNLGQLSAIKNRVEHAIQFLHQVVR